MTITVIESFDPFSGSGPWTGDLAWDDLTGGASNLTVSSSALHITQGTASWKAVTSGAGQATGCILGNSGVDLTGYSTLLVDVYIQQTGGGDTLFGITDNNVVFPDAISNIETTTGAKTLSIDLTAITDPINNVFISLIGGSNGLGGSGTGPAEVYWDNLRVDDGAGGGSSITTLYMHRTTQGMS